MSTTPPDPFDPGEEARQAGLARGEALAPAGAVRTLRQGDLQTGFLGAEDAEEHLGPHGPVQARGYWESIWLRLRKDRLAIAGAVFIVVLIFVAFIGAPLADYLLGHGPNDINPIPGPGGGIDDQLLPVKPWTYVNHLFDDGTVESQLYILGAADTAGRDEFLRLLKGAQVSLEVGIGATAISMFIGLVLGSMAGFFRGT
ncbi:MAG: hypothetical protein EXQ81_10930, partial [Thermoleophilia bacterium]|nr:hypothetical protein [Thermoleophilia bacterium]